jgi:class 3 adenylate cyclase
MNKFFLTLSDIGVNSELSFSERKKTRIVNIVLFINIPVNLIFIMVHIYVKQSLALINVLNLSFVFFLFFLQYKKYLKLARLLLLLYYIVVTFLLGVYVYPGSAIENSMFPIALGVIIFFEELKFTLPLSLISLGTYLGIYAMNSYVSSEIKNYGYNSIAYFINSIFYFILCFFGLRLLQSEHSNYEKIIEDKNLELSQKNEELNLANISIEQERKKSDSLLLNILPEETASELKEKGFATPRNYKLVTVLFTDFKGFTRLSETLSPVEIIEELNKCFFAFDEIILKHNLEKIKTIGDSYMCAGGLPVPNTTNPFDAVRAALEIRDWMESWKNDNIIIGKPVWEIRIGIHCGEVVAGVVGKNKFAYDIWGDTVNLASRMESSCDPGKVNISGTMYELIKNEFRCSYRGKIMAKNKGEAEMYFVDKRMQ